MSRIEIWVQLKRHAGVLNKIFNEIGAGQIGGGRCEQTARASPRIIEPNHEEPYLEPQSEINPHLNPRRVHRINIAVQERDRC